MSLKNVKRGIIERLSGVDVGARIFFDQLPQNVEKPAILCQFTVKDSYADLSGARIGLASGTLAILVYHDDGDVVEDLRDEIERLLTGYTGTAGGVKFGGFQLEQSPALAWEESLQAWEAMAVFFGHWNEERP